MDDRTLMEFRADVLYRHNARGRMLESNEPKPAPAPRLFLGRTLAGDVVRFSETVPDGLAEQLAQIIMRQPLATDIRAPFASRDALVSVLERQAPIAWEGCGPSYRFPDDIAMPREAVQVTVATFALLQDTFPWLYHDLTGWGPAFVVVRDGVAVAACFTARIGPTVCEAGVSTLPAYRGQGHAATVTAAWGVGLQAAGRIPLYSTSSDNLASQSVARRVGLIQFGADASWA